MISDVLDQLNKARAEAGCTPLSLDTRLMQAAGAHADFMARRGLLSHEGENGSTFDQRIRAAGYEFTSAAENVAFGASDAAGVVTLWMNSPPHRANILNADFTDVGIGIANSADKTAPLYWSLSLATPTGPAEETA
ncbi:MAG: hypothetical protein CMN55_13375 [Sneathiella sp.]|jgi:uncharacterized protein YkwD|uniref:CAP domain-containing protein n=1 Tax=Sneathiella sp. TaxID=1964365 RepID=UPI000C64EF89|nr:CAP domain-containing protein [Sneathiella sp.]MAL80080.1 hypothetical protein [Sneathiella sp.]